MWLTFFSTPPWLSSPELVPAQATRSTSILLFSRISTALPPRPLCAPPRGLLWPGVPARGYATPPCHHVRRRARVRATPVPLLAPRVRLDAGKPLVVTSPPASSPAARAIRSTATSASALADAWVRLDRGSRVAASLGALHRVYLAYLGRWIFVLKKGISKMDSKID